ncbi:MAG: DUF2079 domain-containing protein [Thermaerobacter sp.]|nr:DUF2079 domain-containing protein [Thermaerobacter sp.]
MSGVESRRWSGYDRLWTRWEVWGLAQLAAPPRMRGGTGLAVGAASLLAAAFFAVAWIEYRGIYQGQEVIGIFLSWLYHIAVLGQVDPHGAVAWPMLADNLGLDWYPLALLYRLYPHALTLFVVQAAGLAAVLLLVYLVWRRERRSDRRIFWLLPLVAVSPALWGADLFPGHPDFLIPVGILWAHHHYLGRRRLDGAGLLPLLLALGAKEAAALPVAAYGSYLWLKYRDRGGLWIMALGGAWLAGATLVLTAWHVGRIDHFTRIYAALLGGRHGLAAGASFVLTHPWVPIAVLFSGSRMLALAAYLVPLAGLPLAGRAALPGAAVLVVFNLLSSRLPQVFGIWEYGLWPLPLLLLGAMDGLARVQWRRGWRWGVILGGAGATAWLVLSLQVFLAPHAGASAQWRLLLQLRARPRASVAAESALTPYLANRPHLTQLPALAGAQAMAAAIRRSGARWALLGSPPAAITAALGRAGYVPVRQAGGTWAYRREGVAHGPQGGRDLERADEHSVAPLARPPDG